MKKGKNIRNSVICFLLSLVLLITGGCGISLPGPFQKDGKDGTNSEADSEAVPNDILEEGAQAGNTVILTSPVADAAISPEAYEEFIRAALCYEGYEGYLGLVRMDGTAELEAQASLRNMKKDRSQVKIDQSINEILSSLGGQIQAMKAKEPELDIMKGLFMAGDLLRGMEGKRTVLIDSNGLASSGDLNLTGCNILDIDTGKLIEELRAAKALPDLTGLEIIWINLGLVPGDAKAQEELPQIMKSWLEDFYTSLLTEGCGAERVSFYPYPHVGGSRAVEGDLPHKTPVEVYREASELPMLSEEEKNTTTVSISESQVSFRPNTADFVQTDEEVCARLAGLILSLKESEAFHVVIAGGTSSYGQQESSIVLSKERAGRIRDFLLENGVREEQIEGVYGLGFREDSPIYTNDRVNGELVESLAAANRLVVVAGINSDLAKKIVAAGEKASN